MSLLDVGERNLVLSGEVNRELEIGDQPLYKVKYPATDAYPNTLVSLWWIIPIVVIVVILDYLLSGATFSQPWYRSLDTAPWQPPAKVFSIVWGILYILIAIAWYLLYSRADENVRSKINAVFVINAVLLVAWSAFFSQRNLVGALIVLFLTLITSIYLWESALTINRWGATLLALYVGWLAVATSLNIWLVGNNDIC